MYEDTPLVMVEDARTLDEVVERLSHAPVIGVDTESDSFYSYQEKVCLVQISDLDADYIIDPLKIEDLSPLAPIMADRNIPKVLHGADYDIVCLKRDFDFEIRNLFDTLIAAQLLGMKRIGLADLILRYFGHELDKQYQRHDWSARPLLPEHLEYARGDTHFLPALREVMSLSLRRMGRMRHLREECRILEKRKWQGKSFDADGYLLIKRANTLDDAGKRVLRRLYLYRDAAAREMDRPTFKVMPDQVLVRVAEAKPKSLADLDRLFPGMSAMKRRHGKHLVENVLQGLQDDFEIPRAPKTRRKRRTGPRPRLTGRVQERVLNELKDWRNRRVEGTEGLTPYLVASNTTLKAIAARRPLDKDELREIPDVRSWQVDEFGEEILELLDMLDPRPRT